MSPLVSFVTWRRLALGAGAGAVFGIVLVAFLLLTGAMQITPGALPASRVLSDALVNACVQLTPWLLLWLVVLPALLRLPWGQPWLGLLVYGALAVVLVPRAVEVGVLETSQWVALALFALVTALPVVRAADAWLTAGFVSALHMVTVSGAGLFFGGGGGYGLFDARLSGDTLLTGGTMGPVFGLFGMLGLCWVAGSLLQHQTLVFAGAASRVRSRRGALTDFALGVLISASGVALVFIAMQVTQQSRVLAFNPSILPLSSAVSQQLPQAIAAQWLFGYVLIAACLRVVRRGWIAVLLATAVAVGWHLAQPGTTWFTAASAAAMALATGFAFVATGRLWLPVALVCGWLLFEGPVFGFASAGLPVRQPWFQQQMLQYTEWSGGVHGPDASLFGIIAKCLVVAAVVWLRGTGPRKVS